MEYPKVVGYRLNHLDEPIFMAVSKPLLTDFGIHHRLESCVHNSSPKHAGKKSCFTNNQPLLFRQKILPIKSMKNSTLFKYKGLYKFKKKDNMKNLDFRPMV